MSLAATCAKRAEVIAWPRWPVGDRPWRVLAEVGAPDVCARLDLVRQPLGNLAAEVEHHQAVRQVHDHAHVVLDHDHRHAPLLVEIDDEAGHVLLLLEVHAGHRLVEQDEVGLQGDRAR